MPLPAAERTELLALASGALPPGWSGIHFLAALYLRYGAHGAREVTEVIGEGTASTMPGNFDGFIAASDSSGFRREVADPAPLNPQTGHFFSFVVWAQDGISDFEAAAALGHEFFSDHYPGHEVVQLGAGASEGPAFRAYLAQIPLDPNGTLDYATMDGDFSAHGWSSRIVPTGRIPDFSMPGVVIYTDEDDFLTGNSVQDLRCTVAGFHFGRLVRSGLFVPGTRAADWLARNVLDGPAQALSAADVAAALGTA